MNTDKEIPVKMSGSFSVRMVNNVIAKTGGLCAYCGVVLQPVSARTKASLSIDHILPKSRGGKDCLSNLAPACRGCNYYKRGRLLEDWRQILVRRKYGEFTDSHIAHLKSLGLVLPKGFPCYPPYFFWFERHGLML